MTAEELKRDAKKKAQELFELNEQTSQTNDAKKGALITIKQMLEEHSCYTLNDGRWAFWAQVEIELNTL